MSSEDKANATSEKKENKSHSSEFENEKSSKSKKTSKKKQNLGDTTNKNEEAKSSSEEGSEDEGESSPKKQKLGENASKNDKEETEGDENVSTAKSEKKTDTANRKSPARESARIKKQIDDEKNSRPNDGEKFSKETKKQSKSVAKKKVAAKKQEESESESESESSSEEEEEKKRKKKEKRTFTCFHCKQTFLQTTVLFMHTCSGKKEKGFTCEVCGKSFILRSSFINHKIIHSKKKPYKCTLCGKKSSQQSNHLFHMSRAHPGEKPFPCVFFPCSKSFMTRMEQKKHHILHRKILCKYCDQSFADRPTMLKHRESEHEQYFSDGKKSKKAAKVSTGNEVATETSNNASD